MAQVCGTIFPASYPHVEYAIGHALIEKFKINFIPTHYESFGSSAKPGRQIQRSPKF